MAIMTPERKARKKRKPALVTMDDKGRVVVSKKLRESMGIESGDVFEWIEINGHLTLVSIDTEPLSVDTKREVVQARREIAEGGGKSWDDLKRELEL